MNNRYSKNSEYNFILIMGIIFLLITAYLIKYIFVLIVFSLILAYFLYPIYIYFLHKVKNNRISSLITVSLSTIILFLPLGLLSYFLILSLIKLILQYKIYLENPEILNSKVSEIVSSITNSNFLSTINYSEYMNSIVNFILDIIKKFFNSIPSTIMNLAIILFLTYYILVYNKKMILASNKYLPLSMKKQNEILNNITKNLKVLFRGYFLTGIIQTIIAFIGYYMFGLNNLLILTTLTLFTSLIPYVGTPLVWVPASIYLIIMGNEIGGFGLLIYGTVIISMVDNFLRPFLMSDKDTISPPLVFIGFIGGMMAFGISGIILGPLIISITIILFKYVKEYYKI